MISIRLNKNVQNQLKEVAEFEGVSIFDYVTKKISDLGLSILFIVSNKPGIKVPEIFDIISNTNSTINVDKIRYSLKTELKGMIE